MQCRITDLRCKEVINICDGKRIGYAEDVDLVLPEGGSASVTRPAAGTPKWLPISITERNGIYIVDLQKTVKKLEEAYNFVLNLAQNGGSVLFVGTKKQAQESIRKKTLRPVLCQPEMAGRHAHQFQDHARPVWIV